MVNCEYSSCGGSPDYGVFKNASKWPCCGRQVTVKLNFPAAPAPKPEPVKESAPVKKAAPAKKAESKKTKKSKKK
jgi:prophage tail gpP-like protein